MEHHVTTGSICCALTLSVVLSSRQSTVSLKDISVFLLYLILFFAFFTDRAKDTTSAMFTQVVNVPVRMAVVAVNFSIKP